MKPFFKDKLIVYKVGEKVLILTAESQHFSGSWGVVSEVIKPAGAGFWHKFVVDIKGYRLDFQSCQLWSQKELDARNACACHVGTFIDKLKKSGCKDEVILGILQNGLSELLAVRV
jgi:hypothetical protein